MKKKIGYLILWIFVGWIGNATATPILDSDGSLLTGVNVGGILYNVMFADGNLEATYGGIVFDSARATEANAVTDGIIQALNELDLDSPGVINGCLDYECTLFNPDDYIAGQPGAYSDSNPGFGEHEGGEIFRDVEWYTLRGASIIDRFADTAFDPYENITLVRYRPASAPATLALLGLGLAGLGITRGKRTTHGIEDQDIVVDRSPFIETIPSGPCANRAQSVTFCGETL